MGRMVHLGDERGVTLVEIAIAIAIIGMMAMLAVPNILGVLPRMRLNGDTVTLSNNIALARASAISKNQYFAITYDDANESYTASTWTPANDADADGIPDISELQSSYTNTISADIDLVSVQGLTANNTVIARPVGTMGLFDASDSDDFKSFPLGSEAIIELKTEDGLFRKRVIIEKLGRVRVEHQAPGVTTWTEE